MLAAVSVLWFIDCYRRCLCVYIAKVELEERYPRRFDHSDCHCYQHPPRGNNRNPCNVLWRGAAEGFFHEFAGIAVFMVSVVILVGIGFLLNRMEKTG